MAGNATSPLVKTASGTVRGRWNREGSVTVFKGIPYAKPPLGALRWRPPRPAVSWEGTLDADKPGPRAIQDDQEYAVFMEALVAGQGWTAPRKAAVKLFMGISSAPKQSEDCLYLNVRTPLPGRDAALPVMVWIHGGDHWHGSGSDLFYESDALARRGVVVVSINYRLGLMGYFMHPELSRESDQGVSGNYGTLDQIAALTWVRDNIRAFGGDPDNVTIFGESAGGESVAHMMTSPLARGLFHRAIMQSPANMGQKTFLRRPFLNNPAGEENGTAFADSCVGREHNQLATLRRVSAEHLYERLKQERRFRHFYPCIDGYVLPKSPFECFADGEQARVPLLLGSNADEGSLMYPLCGAPLRECIGEEHRPSEIPDLIREKFHDDAPTLLNHYSGLIEGSESAQVALLGDSLFGAPVHFYARQAAAVDQPVYLYLFTRRPPSPRQTAGAFHAAELAFVHGRGVPLFETTPEDAELTRVMGDYWARFAQTGDPNLAPHPEWPLFSPEDQRLMRLGTGEDLGRTEVATQPTYEIFERRILAQIAAMKALRLREREAVRA